HQFRWAIRFNMREDLYFILILVFTVGGFVVDRTLSFLNIRNWSPNVPVEFKELYDADKYEKARVYQHTNFKFANISSGFSLVLMLAMLISGGFGWLDNYVAEHADTYFIQSALFFAILFIGADMLSLPFALYGTFNIEEKFGF